MKKQTEQYPIQLVFADGTVGVMWFVMRIYDEAGNDVQIVHRTGFQILPRLATQENVEWEIADTCRIEIVDGEERCGIDDYKNKLPVRSWRFLENHEIPSRDYRDAVTENGIDMSKARELHKARVLRPARAPLLAALDAEYMKADEAGDKAAKKRIAARKQALRDVTADPAIANAKTIAELKTAAPDKLNGG